MTFALARRTATTIPAAPRAKVRERRFLLPKEHGAYFQLGVPAVTALAMGRLTGSALLFVCCAAAMFLGHESLLVLLGRRGARAKREDGPRAARGLALLAPVALAAGVTAWSIAPSGIGALPLLPLCMAAIVGALVAYRIERTTLGEIAVGAALSSAAMPVAYSAGVATGDAWTAWVAWIVAAAAGTCAVRSILPAQKKTTGPRARVGLIVVILLGAFAVATRWPTAGLAFAPTVLLAILWIAVAPHPRQLRRVGWSLAAGTLAASAILIASLRSEKSASSDMSVKGPAMEFRISQTGWIR
jgi:hypothetical protein